MRFHNTFPGPACTLEAPSFDDPAALLDHCGALGISLWTNGPKLGFDAPSGALTADLRSELVRHKPALLALLRPAPTEPTKPQPDLLAQRWGPGLEDDTPGLSIIRPDASKSAEALRNADVSDPYAAAERLAITAEGLPPADGMFLPDGTWVAAGYESTVF